MTFSRFTIAAVAAALLACAPAHAGDLQSKRGVTQIVYAPQSYDWSGLSIGAHVAHGSGTNNASATSPFGTFGADVDMSGVGFGGSIGYNWQINRIVVGVVGDMTMANISGRAQSDQLIFGFLPTTTNVKYDLDYYATARGLLGFSLGGGNQWLPYVTGGWAVGKADIEGTTSIFGTNLGSANQTSTKSGYTIGGGLAYRPTRNVSVHIEYLRVDLGSITGQASSIFGVSVPTTADMKFDTVRLGAKYHF